jgi:hypothetical protein
MWIDKSTDMHVDRQIDRQTDGQIDGQTGRYVDRYIDGQTDMWIDKQTDRHACMWIDKSTDRQTDRQARRSYNVNLMRWRCAVEHGVQLEPDVIIVKKSISQVHFRNGMEINRLLLTVVGRQWVPSFYKSSTG